MNNNNSDGSKEFFDAMDAADRRLSTWVIGALVFALAVMGCLIFIAPMLERVQ